MRHNLFRKSRATSSGMGLIDAGAKYPPPNPRSLPRSWQPRRQNDPAATYSRIYSGIEDNIVRYILVFLALLFPLSAIAAQDVTIRGKDFYLDGKPWTPKGIDVEAFSRPAFIPSAPKWMNESLVDRRKMWGRSELDAVRNVFHADTIRLDFSQPALDPQSPIYDHQYLSDVLDVIRSVRAQGFVVIAMLNAQGPSGLTGLPCMPGDSTVRAWRALAPGLAHDDGVMFELFNEPCKSSTPDSQKEWMQGTQPIVDAIRAEGAKNILLLDGLWWARQTKGLFPLVHDSLPNRTALAVHPYLVKDTFATEKQWNDMFGADAQRYPMIATEWNAIDSCVADNLPERALSEIRYLQRLHIGLVGWAIDSDYGRLVKDHDHFEPIGYEDLHGCVPTPKGQRAPIPDWGGGKLLAKFPSN